MDYEYYNNVMLGIFFGLLKLWFNYSANHNKVNINNILNFYLKEENMIHLFKFHSFKKDNSDTKYM